MKTRKVTAVLLAFALVFAGVLCFTGCGHEHELVRHEAKAASCTADGNIEYWSCEGCDKLFADKEGKQEISAEDTVVPPNGHKPVHHEQVTATCTADGNIEYWSCENCDALFSDKEGKHEISAEDTVVRVPHDYAESWKSGADGHWHVCRVCGQKSEVTAHEPVAVGEADDPTCTESGTTAGSKCSVCGYVISEPSVIPPNGHKLVHHEEVSASCKAEGVAEHWSCENCGTLFADEEGVTETTADALVLGRVCTEQCAVCGGCLDADCTEEPCARKCGGGKDEHVFEAENADIRNGEADYEYYISTSGGRTFINNLNANYGATVTFTVNAEEAGTASLAVTINRRRVPTVFTEIMSVTVNGALMESPVIIPAFENEWSDESFSRFTLGCVNLQEGENTIVFTVLKDEDPGGYNFDNIILMADGKLTGNEEGEICPVCGGSLDVSGDDGGKICGESKTDYAFEAEDASFMTGPSPTWGDVSISTNAERRTFVQNFSDSLGSSITFTVNTESTTTVSLLVTVSRREQSVVFTDHMSLTVNGTEVKSKKVITAIDSSKIWTDEAYMQFNLGCISLEAGDNTVTFTSIDNLCFNFDKITLKSEVPVTAAVKT